MDWREVENAVARADPDRYVASLFAPSSRRRGLIALYAFNHEIARIREIVQEPLLGHIRLGWWREQIAAIFEGREVTVPLAMALRQTVEAFALPGSLFEAYLEARGLDLVEAPFADEAALEGYTSATAGGLMQLAARVMGAGDGADSAARHAGIAFAYAGYIRSLGFDAAGRFCCLPLAWLEAEQVSPEDVFAGVATPNLRRVITRLGDSALRHSRAARTQKFPAAAITALSPAALVDVYVKRSAEPASDLFGKQAALSETERVARIALATLTRRI